MFFDNLVLMNLSVTELINFYRCPRLLFLNKLGDKTLQIPPSDFLKRLWKVGRNYESTVVDFFKYERPKYKIGDHAGGAKATHELMKSGVETIYQGVLKNDELVGIPDFLIKAKGHSNLGDYYYYPVDIKGASTAKERYLFQLASYSYLLGELQEFTPFYGGLLLLDLDLKIKFFIGLIQQVVYGIEESNKMLSNSESMPPLFIDSNCQMCQWYNFCLPEANEKEDLSLISGVNRKTKAALEKIGVKNYGDLANCTEDDLVTIEEISVDKRKEVIIQAKCLKEKKVYLREIPNITKENKEVYIDFESDMIFDEKSTEMSRVDYLCGLLKYEDGREEYKSLLLETEEQFTSDLAAYLESHMDFSFYHYGHYEQSLFEEKWKDLPRVNLINVEKIIKHSVIMPISSYSLKNISKALGFKWRNKEANAMQSMCWYSSYLDTKDRKYLDLSVEYNHDDCLALSHLNKWLFSLKEKEVPVGEFINISELKILQ